jgi:two-component system invasion response regulator UvrY
MPNKTIIEVGIVDDHKLPRIALSQLISGYNIKNTDHRYEVTFQADNGRDMIDKLRNGHLPEIILLDINMPEMDGYEAAEWLSIHYPGIKFIAITMDESESSVVQMLRRGAKGYLMKDITEEELMQALDSLVTKGHYYSEAVVKKLLNASEQISFHKPGVGGNSTLNEREVEFLKMIGTDLSYKEIADRMFLSPRTIDGYRDALFLKLNVRTRVGLLMYAIKCGIIDLDIGQNIDRCYHPADIMTGKN